MEKHFSFLCLLLCVKERVVTPLRHIYTEIISPPTDIETAATSVVAAKSSLNSMIVDFVKARTDDPLIIQSAEEVRL